MVPKVVSTKNESIRMFHNSFLESLSHIHPATPLVVFVPVIIWFLYRSWVGHSIGDFIVFYGAGLLFWTFLEYVMHRGFFHFSFSSRLGKAIHFLFHGVHHATPNDATRLVMPLSVSVPLAFLVYGLFKFLFGLHADPLFAGIVTGYLAYDMIHFAVHHFPMKNPVARFLKQHHLKHHFTNDENYFGVSNPLWDYVFGTMDHRDQPASVPEIIELEGKPETL